MAYLLIAANSDPEKRSEVPQWHEIFEPVSLRYRAELAEPALPAAPSPKIAGQLLDGFILRHKEAAKKKKQRGRHLKRKPNAE